VDAIRQLVSWHLKDSEIDSVALLGGGFINSNYRLVLRNGRSLVLRISARSSAQDFVVKGVSDLLARDFKKELRVLQYVHGAVPVPAVVAEDFSRVYPFALIEFIAQAGFFDENFVFNPAFENFGGSLYDYICSSLVAGRGYRKFPAVRGRITTGS
jgi:hypothetical protein